MFRQTASLASRQFCSKLTQKTAQFSFAKPQAPVFKAPSAFKPTPKFTPSPSVFANQYAAFSSTQAAKQMKQFQTFAKMNKFSYVFKGSVVASGVAVCPVNHGKDQYSYDLVADTQYVAKMKQHEKEIYKAIEELIEDEKGTFDGYGNFGPLFIRLAWHASGTYDQASKTGGSSGACMRFDPESGHGANAGLGVARDRLEAVKRQFPDLSYADLYTFAGKVAAEALGGPEIPFNWGRSDYTKDSHYKVDSVRLPDAAQGRHHVRTVFTKQMGFTDREIVALLGAHAVGKMHKANSGFSSSVNEGEALPWTYSPLTLSNQYYTTLLEEKWTPRQNPYNNDVFQYENEKRDLIMLPAEYILISDDKFKPFVELYAKDEEVWRKDFAAAFGKLLALGVQFPQ